MTKPQNLVTVRPGVVLEAAAAESFKRVEKRAGRRIDVNSSYRDWDEQMGHYLAYQTYLRNGKPWAPLALHPDRSMHCKGLAIDSDDHALMRAAGEYGWLPTVETEPWHFDYFRNLDTHFGEPAFEDVKPLPIPEPEQKDVIMRTLFITDMKNPSDAVRERRQRVLVGELTYQPMTADAAKVEYLLWGKPENVTHAQALGIQARVIARRADAGLAPE